MSNYHVNFTMDTLYDVAKEFESFISRVDDITQDIATESQHIVSRANGYVQMIEKRLQHEEDKLDDLQRELRDAEWYLSQARSDKNGNANAVRYWTERIKQLEAAVKEQEKVVKQVREDVEKVKSKARVVIYKTENLRMLTTSYRNTTSDLAAPAPIAIKQCIDVMSDYWNLKDLY